MRDMKADALYQEIENGLKHKEFVAYYQPQYDTVTGKMVSAEALVRWVKPDGTLVPPFQFIPYSEEAGLVVDIDWYMLNEVCESLKHKKAMGKRQTPISINFSRLHMTNPRFVEKLCDIVDSHGIEHGLIEVEITESAMMETNIDIVSFVKGIQAQGFKVAIDDFGSGFSSLSMIHDISADILKIDKSLISKNCESEKERIVLESIFTFAQRLKLKTIAEGVETNEQLGFLRTCGCNCIQGYIFAKPMPESEFFEISDEKESREDIILIQSATSANNLLMEAIFAKFPMVMMSNLTRNSYYMMAYEDFSRKSCPSAGKYDELIVHGTATMHPDDKELFANTCSLDNVLQEHAKGAKCISCVTKQMGDDGIYREVETCGYFVKSPSSDDVLMITFCQNIE